MQDKSQQYALSAEQVQLFQDLLGEDGATEIIHEKTVYSFNPDVMEQPLLNIVETTKARKANPEAMPVFDTEKTVLDWAMETISAAIADCPLLTDEQKESIIQSKTGAHLRPGTVDRVADLCARDTNRIEQFFTAAGSEVVRYCKC